MGVSVTEAAESVMTGVEDEAQTQRALCTVISTQALMRAYQSDADVVTKKILRLGRFDRLQSSSFKSIAFCAENCLYE